MYDTGTAWVTVNGCQGTANYGQSDTAATVAASVAAAVNASCGQWVTAAANGTTVGLTAAQTGGNTNYSLSAGSATSQPGSFSGPSFSISASGGNLVSGTNPTSYSYALTYAPDGDVVAANDSVNGNWTYSYDDFNRLVSSACSAECPDGQGTQGFGYVYDRYANRWQQNVTAGSGPQPQATFNGNNNRIDGDSYDADGNLLYDGVHSYTYDAESRIVAVDGGGTATYVYDAEGRRVQKTTAGGTVSYIYDIAGEQVAEVNSSGGATREEVYAGGRHVATYTNGTTYFDHADWLGTERMRTTATGASCETIVSLAFGDGTATTGSCSDASPMHFTGKQHDSESNLDDFDARYYSSQWGRFISADWSADPEPVPYANFTNPQTLNLYAIVADNPGTFADLDGHVLQLAGNVSADENAIEDMVGDASQYLDFHSCGKETCVNFNPPGMDMLPPGAKQVYDWVKSPDLFVFSVKPLGKNTFEVDVARQLTAVERQAARNAALAKLIADAGMFAAMFVPEGEDAAIERELAAAEAEARVEATEDVTEEIIERKARGADGATSRIIREKVDGKTNSVTHQVTNEGGDVIHQHQTHEGSYGGKRQFPDEWIKYPKIPRGI